MMSPGRGIAKGAKQDAKEDAKQKNLFFFA
jgi:hypothetical protein